MLKSFDLYITLMLETDEPLRKSRNALKGAERALRDLESGNIKARFWAYPEFLVPLAQPLGEALDIVLVGWILSLPGRKIRFRVGDIEAVARTAPEIMEVLDHAIYLEHAIH